MLSPECITGQTFKESIKEMRKDPDFPIFSAEDKLK